MFKDRHNALFADFPPFLMILNKEKHFKNKRCASHS
nr:MAG TPA: hypothetical protein [Inoviridae sp.]